MTSDPEARQAATKDVRGLDRKLDLYLYTDRKGSKKRRRKPKTSAAFS